MRERTTDGRQDHPWQYDEELDDYVPVDFHVLFDAGPNDELTDADVAVICERLA